MHILIADDDEQQRSTLAALLADEGHTVTTAADGAEALESFRHGNGGTTEPDLVITDCQMPRLDGLSLTRGLRAAGVRAPIIMLSGQEQPAVITLALGAGVDRYVRKPLRPAALLDVIRNLTTAVPSSQAAPAGAHDDARSAAA